MRALSRRGHVQKCHRLHNQLCASMTYVHRRAAQMGSSTALKPDPIVAVHVVLAVRVYPAMMKMTAAARSAENGVCQEPRCGDSVVNGDEECDDGNDVDSDACRTNCQIAACGDGVVQVGIEDCDDGNSSIPIPAPPSVEMQSAVMGSSRGR